MATQIWSLSTGNPLGPRIKHLQLPGRGGSRGPLLQSYQINDDASHLALVQGDPRRSLVQVVDTRTGKPIGESLDHQGTEVTQLVFSHDDRRLVSSSRGRPGQLSVRVWDAANDYELLHHRTVESRQSSGQSRTELDPSCKRFAVYSGQSESRAGRSTESTATSSNVVFVCEFISGQTKRLHHELGIINVAFSPDGQSILTNCLDKTIRIWNSTTGELVRSLKSPNQVERFGRSSFSNDGRRVIAVQRSGNLTIWDVATGQPLTPSLRKESDSFAGRLNRSFSQSLSTGFISGAADRFVIKSNGRFVIYDLSADTRPADDLMRMTRALSGRGINPLGNVESVPPQQWRQEWQRAKDELYERVLAAPRGEKWHRRQFANSDDAWATLWHLDRLINAGKKEGELFQRRGTILARLHRHEDAVADFDAAQALNVDVYVPRGMTLAYLKRWGEAAADLDKAASQTMTQGAIGFSTSRARARIAKFSAGVAYLSDGNTDAYERVCEEVLGMSFDSRSVAVFLNVIRLGLLVPRDNEYCRNLQDRFDAMIADAPRSSVARFSLERAPTFDDLIAFRRGDYESALKMNNDRSKEDRPGTATAGSLLIQAMAHKQLGQDGPARDLLQQATQLIHAKKDVDQVVDGRNLWVTAQITQLLHQEAMDMIGDGDEDSEVRDGAPSRQ